MSNEVVERNADGAEPGSWLTSFLGRTPFALIGALGLVSFASGVIQLEQNIADWLRAWKAVTRPVWDFVFGWAFTWLQLPFPSWLKDYFTLGLISTGMFLRTNSAISGGLLKYLMGWDLSKYRYILQSFLLWPYEVFMVIRWAQKVGWKKSRIVIYLETIIYALIIIAINYALIFGGAPASP